MTDVLTPLYMHFVMTPWVSALEQLPMLPPSFVEELFFFLNSAQINSSSILFMIRTEAFYHFSQI